MSPDELSAMYNAPAAHHAPESGGALYENEHWGGDMGNAAPVFYEPPSPAQPDPPWVQEQAQANAQAQAQAAAEQQRAAQEQAQRDAYEQQQAFRQQVQRQQAPQQQPPRQALPQPAYQDEADPIAFRQRWEAQQQQAALAHQRQLNAQRIEAQRRIAMQQARGSAPTSFCRPPHCPRPLIKRRGFWVGVGVGVGALLLAQALKNRQG